MKKESTKRIPRKGYGTIQRDVMTMNINIHSKAVYCLLQTFTGSDVSCFPSIKTIVEALDISKSSVIRSIKELESRELIHVIRRKKANGDNEVNRYIPDVLYDDIPSVTDGLPSLRVTPPSLSETPPLVSPVDTKNNNIKNNKEESLISNDEIKISSVSDNISKEEEEPNVYSSCMALYDQLIRKITDAPPQIDALSGRSLKTIIVYLEKMVKEKHGEIKNDEVIRAFNYILSNFYKWDKFHQTQLKLNQISSNLVNIISSIKNGNSRTTAPLVQPGTKWRS